MQSELNRRPLTAREQGVVADNLYHLDQFFKQRRFTALVGILGYEDSYQLGCLALIRSAKTWKPDFPFHVYAAFWVRGFLCKSAGKYRKLFGAPLFDDDSDDESLRDRRQERDLDGVADRDDLVDLLSRLPSHVAKIILLGAQGVSDKEIANRLGYATKGHTAYHLKRAEALLSREVSRAQSGSRGQAGLRPGPSGSGERAERPVGDADDSDQRPQGNGRSRPGRRADRQAHLGQTDHDRHEAAPV